VDGGFVDLWIKINGERRRRRKKEVYITYIGTLKS
jgi:hypothetical protein